MKSVSLVIICISAFLLQIIFSIFYSVKIVDENTLINSQQDRITDLTIKNQELKIALAGSNSLSKIYEASGSGTLRPINKTLDLRE